MLYLVKSFYLISDSNLSKGEQKMPKELLLLLTMATEAGDIQLLENTGFHSASTCREPAAFAVFNIHHELVYYNQSLTRFLQELEENSTRADLHRPHSENVFSKINALTGSFDDRFILHEIGNETYLCFFENSSQFQSSPDSYQFLKSSFPDFVSPDIAQSNQEEYAHFAFFFRITDLEATLSKENLTALFRLLADLKQNDQEYDIIFDNVFDLLTITDGNGVLLKTNSAIEKVFGLSKSEAIGYSVHDLEKNGVLSKSITKEVLLRKQPMTLIQDTQTGRRLVVNSTPLFDSNGEIHKIFNTSQDITTLKAMEEKLSQAEEIIKEHEHRISILRKGIESPNFMMTSSIQMRELFDTVRQITNFDSTVLIEGETGVGKSYLAQQIHNTSSRKDGPFVHVNCGAIPDNLLESELFGYEKGAFTGALETGKDGLVDAAAGGTLFLDEISEVPLILQTKLLELIQTKSYYRIGTTSPRKSNIRIIAATNRNIKQMINDGEFREDLYYRLNVVPLYIPPLRERRSEIRKLSDTFLSKFNEQYGLSKRLSQDALNIMMDAEWPGNIRELENLIERLVVTSKSNIIDADDLPPALKEQHTDVGAIDFSISRIIPLKEAQKQLERAMINKALEIYPNKNSAALALGVHRTTILRKMDDDTCSS